MKIDAKLSKKYATPHTVMLPPPPEETLDFDLPEHLVPTIEDPDMDFMDALQALKDKNKKPFQPVGERNTMPYTEEETAAIPFTAKEAQLYVKYAVMLPPPMEEMEKSPDSVPSLKTQKVSPFLSQFVLEEGDDALDPAVFEEFEPEATNWRQNKLTKDVEDDFETRLKDMEDDSYKPPAMLAPDESTIPPPKKKASLSPDKLIKLCSKYYNLASK